MRVISKNGSIKQTGYIKCKIKVCFIHLASKVYLYIFKTIHTVRGDKIILSITTILLF